MKYVLLILSISVIFLSCKHESKSSDMETATTEEGKELSEAELLAQKNGIDSWEDVRQIDFTFNVDRGGQNVAKRSWSWKPQTGDVIMMSATDTLKYNRSSMDSIAINADRGFINDKYWLLAPYQIVWDEGTSISYEKDVESPLAKKNLNKLTLVYQGDGGYNPGDAYDFFYDDDYKVTEWIFRKGNAQEPSMVTTFEGYQNFKGLHIATEHKNEDGSFKLYFTDIVVSK